MRRLSTALSPDRTAAPACRHQIETRRKHFQLVGQVGNVSRNVRVVSVSLGGFYRPTVSRNKHDSVYFLKSTKVDEFRLSIQLIMYEAITEMRLV